MEATETMTLERMEATEIAQLLARIAPLFAYLHPEEYAAVVAEDFWGGVAEAASRLARNDDERARWARSLQPLEPAERMAASNELLVSGMPLAAMPVESLYKQWTQLEGNAFGAQRGMYMGDAARHVRALLAAFRIELPARFASMPDHLAIELELLSLLVESGNEAAAREFARDHLDWLEAYDEALAQRASSAASGALDSDRRATVLRGIDFTRALLAVTDRLVRAVA